jgi:hypothetical protein
LSPVGWPPSTCNRKIVNPVGEIPPKPVNAKLFTCPGVIDAIETPLSAFADEVSVQSDGAIGNAADGAHSPTRARLFAFDVAFTNTFNVAPVTVAPAGSPEVSNRNSGTYTP